jgi:hypothetical protein
LLAGRSDAAGGAFLAGLRAALAVALGAAIALGAAVTLGAELALAAAVALTAAVLIPLALADATGPSMRALSRPRVTTAKMASTVQAAALPRSAAVTQRGGPPVRARNAVSAAPGPPLGFDAASQGGA